MSIPRFSVDNPVLVNLVMALIVIVGGFYALTTTREIFPNIDSDSIRIATAYPGATPEEIEDGILLRIENRVFSVEGVDEVVSVATASGGVVTVSLETGYSAADVKETIRSEIDDIQDFPNDAETPRLTEIKPLIPVIVLSLYGDADPERLQEKAKVVRDALLTLDGISQADLIGGIPREISVNVHPDKLRQYGISFREIAAAISTANIDLSGGRLRGDDWNSDIGLRHPLDYGRELERLELRQTARGTNIKIGDVATIIDGFADIDFGVGYNGETTVQIMIKKNPTEDAIEIADSVRAFAAGMLKQPLPDAHPVLGKHIVKAWETGCGISTDRFKIGLNTDVSRYIRERLDTMNQNAKWGLLLVMITLMIFLNWRVAFWTGMGLPIAFLGAFIVMRVFGTTLNMLSMFGIIVALGMIVDDAIIIAENVYRLYEKGLSPRDAAIKGTEEVFWPVIGAVATTCAAFLPLAFLDGMFGKAMGALAVVVVGALCVSLLEALFILPSHLAETMPERKPDSNARFSIAKLQAGLINVLRDKLYEPIVRFVLIWRYPFLAGAITLFLLIIGYTYATTRLQFAPDLPAERLNINLKCEVGTPISVTEGYVKTLETAINTMLYDETTKLGAVSSLISYSGLSISFGAHGASGDFDAPHLATLTIELVDEDKREYEADEIIAKLRPVSDLWAGVEVEYEKMKMGPSGGSKEIEFELHGDDINDLLALSKRIQTRLRDFEGTHSISDDYEAGRVEHQLILKDSARAFGLTNADLALQVRHAIYGLEATTFRRADDEIKVMIRYPEKNRRSIDDLRDIPILLPNGSYVPFHTVATSVQDVGTTIIQREDRKRRVVVGAELLDASLANEIMKKIESVDFPDWKESYPNITVSVGGSKEDFQKTLNSLIPAASFAVIVIFVILAVEFNSFSQPFIVMSAIPFGIIGAFVGHKIHGQHLTVMSLIGLTALTGIVVNDSLVLIDFINRNRRIEKMPISDAIIDAARSRLRPILLTSITTIAGLMPLLLETSIQAQIMVPSAIAIAYGLLFSTVLILLVVPAIYYVFDDLGILIRPLLFWKQKTDEPIDGDKIIAADGDMKANGD